MYLRDTRSLPLRRAIALGLVGLLAACTTTRGPAPAPSAEVLGIVQATAAVDAALGRAGGGAPPEPAPLPPPAAAAPAAPAPQHPLPQAVATLGPFAMNLYERGDFATQVTKHYCVPGAMQTMMNVMDRGAKRASRAIQDRLYRLARRLSTDRLRGQGAEPEGWARGLERLGYGQFAVLVEKTRADAIREAALAMRRTGRPVGLLVWRGAHSWVMVGFQATADPALTADFSVTHVRIADVWYPRVSSIWGASVKPGTLIPAAKLKEDYLPWRRPTMRYPDKDGRFVIVAPVAPGLDTGEADPIG
jgi:hypothetical protein